MSVPSSSMPSPEARREQFDRLKRSHELVGLEEAVKHLRYSINLMIEHEKRLQTRAELIKKMKLHSERDCR